MQAKRLREVRELLGSPELREWYGRFREARRAIDTARGRREDLLAQVNMVRFQAETTQQSADEALFAAGEYEDSAARAHAELSDIENSSFEALGAFEVQRQRATEAWAELGGAEQLVEEGRQHASELRAWVEAARKVGSPEGIGEAERLRARLREIELRIEECNAQAEKARGRDMREQARKAELWREVEAAWNSAFAANMARFEYQVQARRARRRAEQLFVRAAAGRRRVGELEADAERMAAGLPALEERLEAVLEEARARFGCALVEEFLYWANTDDVRTAWCVPLVEDRDSLNIQVSALQVYKVERARGLEMIEPVMEPDGQAEGDDVRLAAFFLGERHSAGSPGVSSRGEGRG